MAIAAMDEVFKEEKGLHVMDVGAGFGLLGPTLSHFYHASVVEIDPDPVAIEERKSVNACLKKLKAPSISVAVEDIENMSPYWDPFDCIFCMSVLEHVEPDVEKDAWEKFALHLKPGGLLFVTVDCMEEDKPMGEYPLDSCRKVRFTPQKLQERVKAMKKTGFTTVGEEDWKFHGNFLSDSYTFASVALQKGN